MISDLVEVAGLGCVVAAAFLVAPPLGLLVLGLALLLLGTAVSGSVTDPTAE